MMPIVVDSLAAHGFEGGRASPMPWPLSWKRAYSSPQAIVINHVGGRPHLLPRVLPFASATKALNCMGCYSFTNPGGWKAELA